MEKKIVRDRRPNDAVATWGNTGDKGRTCQEDDLKLNSILLCHHATYTKLKIIAEWYLTN